MAPSAALSLSGQTPPASAEAPVSDPTAPAWASDLNPWPSGLFDSRKAPELRWQPLGASCDPSGQSIVYPSWLAGTWKVEFKKSDVRFPQGWFMLNEQVPGVAMTSILRLPNIGADPTATWRFTAVPETGGSAADWSFNLGSTLEAFWGDAKVENSSRQPGAGLALAFKAPTSMIRKGNYTQRTVTSTWLAAESWQDSSQRKCLTAEWIRQRDDLQAPDGVSDYKILTALQKNKQGTGATGIMRVAGFLQPVDEKYIEANGAAVAVYDYALQLSPA